MTYLEEESSIEDSAPRIGIEFILPAYTRRIAVGVRDITIDGKRYRAASSKIGEVGVSASADPQSLTVTLPMSHQLCQRYMSGGVPPRLIVVNVYRQQGSGLTQRIWTGEVTSLAPDDNVGNFNVPSRSSESYQRRLPTITAGRSCGHILYDSNCRVVRADYAIEAVVTDIDTTGHVITIDALGGHADQWAKWGELEHLLSGERMTVSSQVGLDITIQLPIYGIEVGHHVVVSPGCDHHAETGCSVKFNNIVNFGGFPSMRTEENPFKGWVLP